MQLLLWTGQKGKASGEVSRDLEEVKEPSHVSIMYHAKNSWGYQTEYNMTD